MAALVPVPLYPDETRVFSPQDVAKFFAWAAKNKVSDITLQTGVKAACSRDGWISKVTRHTLTSYELDTILVRLYNGEVAKAIIQRSRDLDFAFEVSPDRDTLYRFRVNAVRVRAGSQAGSGMQITARVISDMPPTVEALGVEPEILDLIRNTDQGLILVTGATGSGKSTLLASWIRYLLELTESSYKIITYEAPIEYVYDRVQSLHSLVAQTEIGLGKDLETWPEAVRDALRRNPNIILFGEARDAETIAGTIEAAQTGHQTFTTIHTEDFQQTIRRMLNAFSVEEKNGRANDILSALRLVVSQRLVPSTDGHRVALKEYVIFDDDIVEMFLEGGLDNLQKTSREVLKAKGHSFLQDAQEKLAAGRITEETFRRVAKRVAADAMDALIADAKSKAEGPAAVVEAIPEGGSLFQKLLHEVTKPDEKS